MIPIKSKSGKIPTIKQDKEVLPVLSPSSEAHRMFLNCKSNFVIFGGGASSGKSYCSLMLILKYVDDPNFKCVVIRQTNPQLTQAGGLFVEAQSMWKPYGAVFRSHPNLSCTFPSGAKVEFKPCGADKDIHNFDGGQFSLVLFDEAQWHTETQIKYLESRIRSRAKAPHQLLCTANPSRTSYLYQFVEWYLDMETGIPKRELSGTERYYATYNGATVVGASKEELLSKYGDTVIPQTYTYIAATVDDNPIMKKKLPQYVARLQNLKRTERERLYLGSWHAKEEAAGYFKREWVEEVNEVPSDVHNRRRGMDLAASLPSEAYPDPDWTASVMMSKGKDGFYYVEHAERYRKLINGVLEQISETDRRDKELGLDLVVVIPKDPAQAGAAAAQYFVKFLTENNVLVKTEPSSGHASKLSRMQPFLSLAEAGLVRVVKGDWNEVWYSELEDYIDKRRDQKDDLWDATATATKAVMQGQTLPTFTMPILTQSSPIPVI